MDLKELGTILKERRETLGIPRAELARRVGVSPSYVWMVEEAKPRKRGLPSQPSQVLLERWANVLGWEQPYTQQLLILAGHLTQESAVRPKLPFSGAGVFHFPQPKNMEEEVLVRELRQVLRCAGDEDKWDEVVKLLRSFLGWLKFRLEDINE